MNRDYSDIKDDEILNRRNKVWEMRVNGYTVREIAAAVGMSVGCIHKDIAAVRAELDHENKYRAEAERAIGASRLDKVARALLTVVAAVPFDKDGNVDAGALATVANAVARVEERRAKLLGLDAATKTELTGADGGPLKIDARNALLDKLSRLATGDAPEGQASDDTPATDA